MHRPSLPLPSCVPAKNSIPLVRLDVSSAQKVSGPESLCIAPRLSIVTLSQAPGGHEAVTTASNGTATNGRTPFPKVTISYNARTECTAPIADYCTLYT